MKYHYKAKKDLETIEGVIEAENSAQAVAKLEQMGCLPIKIEAEAKSKSQSISSKPGAPSRNVRKRISSKDINIFTRQLSSMMKSKVHLLRALEILSKETQSLPFRKIIAEMREEVKQGKQLSDALAHYPKYFSRIYVNMVASGEKGGMLDSMLLRLAEFADWEEDMKSKIQAALAYPALMLVMGVVSVFVMITFIMPKMTKLFADMGQDLPLPTRILMTISQLSRDYWYWGIAGIWVLGFIIKRSKIIEKNRATIDGVILKIPLIGASFLHREIARFCRTVSLLIGFGIPIRDALEITIPTLGNRALEKELGSVSHDLASGLSVSQSLAKVSFFPGFVLSLITVGEESGRLGESFAEIAQSYERELNTEIKIISSLLEPLLILAIGLVVGFIAIAMLLPIFDLNLK